MAYTIVAAARDRAAVDRSIGSALSGVAFVIGLMVARHGIGVPVPITEPLAGPAPVVVPDNDDQPGGRGHRLLVTADADGSCYIAGRVNGALFNRMLIDTGAGGYSIVLGRNHAARAGFDPDKLDYAYSMASANGEGHEAIVTLREFRIGSFVLHDVRAEISDAEVFAPLIGVGIWQKLGLRVGGGRCEFRLPS